MEPAPSILVAGYGTMTGAMVAGWLTAGIPPSAITACGPRPKAVPDGMRFVAGVPDGAFDILVLGMKPQQLAAAAPALEPLAGPRTTVVSVLAGVELASLARHFPRAGAIARLMPNLAAAIGKSPCALVARGLDPAGREQLTRLAEMLGSAEWLADETRFELVTALTGSGPAFVYRFTAALAEAAARLGLEGDQAQRLAVQMVDGAASLAASAGVQPAELARRVASPGGMTERGLAVLDDSEALVRLMADALRATSERGAELAAAAREPETPEDA